MATHLTTAQPNSRFYTPEDFGGVGFIAIGAAIANGFDNTAAMQALMNSAVSDGLRVRVPRKFYRCNSTVNVPMIGEIVFEGRIARPHPSTVTSIRCVGQSTLGLEDKGGRIILGVEHSNIVTPPWSIATTYAPIFDNTYSVYLATLETYDSFKNYVVGDEIQHLGIGYRALRSTVGDTPASSALDWAPFSLAITDGGGQTVLQRLAAETDIGIKIDSMFNRTIEIEQASGYAIGVAVKPRALVDGSSQTAWTHVMIHSSQQNKVGLALISGGPTNWINECSFDCKNFAISSSITAGARGLYGCVIMNDDSLGNYSPNGNRFSGIDMEYSQALACSEFCQIVIHKGAHNRFENTRADEPGYRTAKLFRHPVISDNPAQNSIVNSTRIQQGGAINNGYENTIHEIGGRDDILSLQYSLNDLGNRLVYSGADKAMIRGLPFWNGTAFTRFENSQYCFKHYDSGRIYVNPNARPGLIVYPGKRKYNSYWTIAMRGRTGRFGFQCYNAAGAVIGQTGATPTNNLIQNSTVWFGEYTVLGQLQQYLNVDFDDSNAAREKWAAVPLTFHEVVDKAVFTFYGDSIEGFELRAYNSPGARVTQPVAHNDEAVINAEPKKGQYIRPWRAMYETANGGAQQCILDVGDSVSPTSWATSGSWAGSGSSTLREERHVSSGTDYRVYRCDIAGTVGATAPVGVVYGVNETPAGGTSQWQFMGIADQIAGFADL